MDNAVTVFVVLFTLTVLCSVTTAMLLYFSERENCRLRKENELFRRLWNEQMSMENNYFRAYAEMFRRTGQAAERSYPPENGR